MEIEKRELECCYAENTNSWVSETLLPTISIVIPTLNSEKVLPFCLESIKKQKYPRNRIEIIIIDGGSRDKTVSIAKKFDVDKILLNHLKTGEAGKAIGVKNAKNEIIAFIDSDNILEDEEWMKKMVIPFEDTEIIGSEPIFYTYRREDHVITRYCALMGMHDPLTLYLAYYDRYCYITGKWTGLHIATEDRGKYLMVKLEDGNIPSIGANGFMVRRECVLKSKYEPYLFDMDIVHQMVKNGDTKYAKVKIGIVHLFADDTRTFVKKQTRLIKDYLFYADIRINPLKGFTAKLRLIRFFLSCLLVLPLLIDVLRGYNRVKDKAWLYHMPACLITLSIYGKEIIKSLIKKQPMDRAKVSQTTLKGSRNFEHY